MSGPQELCKPWFAQSDGTHEVAPSVLNSKPSAHLLQITAPEPFSKHSAQELSDAQEIRNFILINQRKNLSTIIENLMDTIICKDIMNEDGIGSDNMTCIIVQFK